MTNYGTLAILARQSKQGPGSEADLRLLLALETITPDSDGGRCASFALVADLAGLGYSRARRALARLIAEGAVIHSRGQRGHTGSWRFGFPLTTAHHSEHWSGEPLHTQGEHYSGEPLHTLVDTDPDQAEPLHTIVSTDRNGITAQQSGQWSERTTAHPGGAAALKANNQLAVTEATDGARDDDDGNPQPDWLRGPGRTITGRVLPASSTTTPTRTPPPASQLCPRGCGKVHGSGWCPLDEPDPDRPRRRSAAARAASTAPDRPAWTAHKPQPPDVAARGAELARELLAQARQGDRPGPAPAPHSDDDRRELALRQARAARAARAAGPHPPGDDETPPDEIPF